MNIRNIFLLSIVCLLSVFTQKGMADIRLPKKSAPVSNEAKEPILYPMEAKLRVPSAAPTPTPQSPKSVPFGVGEKLRYTVNWGTINAGTATTLVENIIDYQEHQVYRVVATAESNSFFSVFYRVNDLYETFIDVKGFFPRYYSSKKEEGTYRSTKAYEFNQEQHTARRTDKDQDKDYYIRYGIQDEVSVIYHVRTLDLHVGTPFYVDIFADKKNWSVKCNVLKTETITVPAGEFETILVEPELQFDGIMKKGKIKIWFTNDTWHIPVKVESKVVIIGSINIQLESYQLGEGFVYDKQEEEGGGDEDGD